MADLARQAGLSDGPGGGSAGAKDKAERDARIAGDLTDELTVAIALREYERAVQLVEDGEKQVETILFSHSQSDHHTLGCPGAAHDPQGWCGPAHWALDESARGSGCESDFPACSRCAGREEGEGGTTERRWSGVCA
jgi:hypothetical protein